ncbi:CYFA0S01e04412g1_1 [Cyberlindnera fabianii]|uniref:CYFA0S01e04412g1_1 n=1 Tax=Cyberlindnera fabianii TaxID=36022 RepID=A0A061AI17_CYBFA|nr:CYFA0S01e04412g1_1 [Cyberlindnera fabianii]
MSVVPNIPGFYYDPDKKKYFKIEKNTASKHQYSDTTINARKAEEQREAKRARLRQREAETQPQYPAFLNIMGKLHQRSYGEVMDSIDHQRLASLKPHKVLRYNLSTTLTKAHTYNDNQLLLSDLNNVYSFDKNAAHAHDETEPNVMPTLIWNRVNKSTSILRKMVLIDNRIVTRTWFGSMDEPSEVEMLTLNDDMEVVAHYSVAGKKRQTYNTSVYNEKTSIMTMCSPKCISTFDVQRPFKSDIAVDGDPLSISQRDEWVSYVGFRSGDIRVWDKRDKFQRARKFRPPALKSIINLELTNPDRLLCSSIGSRIQLFDVRSGFETAFQDFYSMKNVVNVFGETLEPSIDGHFIVQTKNLIEIFSEKCYDPARILSGEGSSDRYILGASWDKKNDELISLSRDSVELYS